MTELHKFIFEGLPVRGMLVRLTGPWREVLARRSAANDVYPPAVRSLLGEMAAAAVLMQANIKFNGALILQAFGDGPVKLAVAEVQPDLAFRVTAKVVGDVDADARLEAMLNVHGQGRCAITLDPLDKLPGQQPYQGVVGLRGDSGEPLQSLSEVLGLQHVVFQHLAERLQRLASVAAQSHHTLVRLLTRELVERVERDGAAALPVHVEHGFEPRIGVDLPDHLGGDPERQIGLHFGHRQLHRSVTKSLEDERTVELDIGLHRYQAT